MVVRTRGANEEKRRDDNSLLSLVEPGESDEEFMNADGGDSSESSDVEGILVDYDSDGVPKEVAEDNHGVPKLPPEFKDVMRRRRFRKKYAGPSIHETILFAKTTGMTKFGKLDRRLQRATDVFDVVDNPGKTVDSGKPRYGCGPDVVVTSQLLEIDISKWLNSDINFSSSINATKEITQKLTTIYTIHLTKLRALIPETGTRVRDFLGKVLATGDICVDMAREGHLHSLTSAISIRVLLREVDAQIAAKSSTSHWLQLYKNYMPFVPPEFDESSNWGLKPLRHTFMPPYFKNRGAQIAAPLLFKRTSISRLVILITSTKQKWTVKDLTELQTSIRKSVLEKRLVQAKEFADIAEQVTGGGIARLRPQKNFPGSEFAPGCDNVPISLRLCGNSNQVRDWFRRETARIRKIKYDQIFDKDGSFTVKDVDWNDVSAKLMNVTKKLRLAEDCRNCFLHAANPIYDNRRRWSAREKTTMKTEADKRKDWARISTSFPKNRPEFVVFYKWRKAFNAPRKIFWNKVKEDNLRYWVKCHGANWNKVPVEVEDFGATKKQVQERFKKTLNPLLRFGKFTRVEDSLMLLTMEKLKGQFGREKHFGIMTAFLPWRYESAWRDRVENLFAQYIVPWTLDEDKKLMQLALSMRRDWSKIAKEFNSFKTRKGCLTRFKILEKRLGRFKSLEQYHDAYAMIRYNVREYQHLKDISTLLKSILGEKVYAFRGLARDRAPTEDELQELILSFDREVMASTIQMVDTYITMRDEYWSDWRKKNGVQPGEKRKTHDRRTFHRDNTQSIASALHIREVKLIPQETLKFKLTTKESEIYRFYARFCSTKPLKKDMPRPYIPLASFLVALPEVKRIVIKEPGQGQAGGRKRVSVTPVEEVPKKRKNQRRKVVTPKCMTHRRLTL